MATEDGTDITWATGMEPDRMDTGLGLGPLDEASRARRASLFRLAACCDMVERTLTILVIREGMELTGMATPLLGETTEVGRSEKVCFPVAGTKATLVPGFTSKGVPEKSSFCPADTITGAPPVDAVSDAADTATAVAMWGLGRMERRPGEFWEC